jgi:hypothetical protein
MSSKELAVSTGAGGRHKSSTIYKYYFGEVMAQNRSFYQDLTEIAESRITELVRHAEEWEAQDPTFANSGSYFHACAFTIYLAWRDVTVGLHTENDLERLEALAHGIPWEDEDRGVASGRQVHVACNRALAGHKPSLL